MSILKGKIKAKNPHAKPSSPVWTGPNGEGKNGGCTQGLLSRYLVCPERFRIGYIEGLKVSEGFSSRMEFGNYWHHAEEALAIGGDWTWAIQQYGLILTRQYPMQREEINHWYNICKELFPIYVEYWAEHDDVKNRTPLLQEQAFDIPYTLPSGRVVRLRGKWDSVDLVKNERNSGIWLMENKTKSGINEGVLRKQMHFDLQTMLYLVALNEYAHQGNSPFKVKPHDHTKGDCFVAKGVRYNVIRRSAHKSVDSMLKKIADDRKANRMDEWFLRFNVEITAKDIERFKMESLNPVLENLYDDYEWWVDCLQHGNIDGYTIWDYKVRREAFDYHQARHFRAPFHYNPLLDGAATDLDSYLTEGTTVGLHRTETLFPELE